MLVMPTNQSKSQRKFTLTAWEIEMSKAVMVGAFMVAGVFSLLVTTAIIIAVRHWVLILYLILIWWLIQNMPL